MTTVRTLLAIILEENLFAYQMDAKNAFLHGTLKEEIYMKISRYIPHQDISVCRLRKTLYGLKQEPRAWNETFNTFVRNIGLQNSKTDKCLYVNARGSHKLLLLLYVDDIIIAGDNVKEIQQVKAALSSRFHMKDLGELQSFLRIDIRRTSDELRLNQTKYTQKFLKRFSMEDCKPAKTPMEMKPPEEENSEVIDETISRTCGMPHVSYVNHKTGSEHSCKSLQQISRKCYGSTLERIKKDPALCSRYRPWFTLLQKRKGTLGSLF